MEKAARSRRREVVLGPATGSMSKGVTRPKANSCDPINPVCDYGHLEPVLPNLIPGDLPATRRSRIHVLR